MVLDYSSELKAVELVKASELKRIQSQEVKQQAVEDSKPMNQEHEDVKRMATIIKEHPGIIEFDVKQILHFTERRYIICRRNLLSFYRGAITLGRLSRVFNYQEVVIEKTIQETL